jgi:exonuclease SbcD
MVTILHFADAHIDMANYGRHDPISGLPARVMDFLKSLDTIVDTAIQEKVDLVLFAGDAYKDRSPAPTFQREWGRRIMRLSRAGIPVLLLVGNHDLSPALGRAHALESFDTLEVPLVRVAARPELLGPKELFGLPLQILALPWVTRSGFIARQDLSPSESVYEKLETGIGELVSAWLTEIDPNLPTVLTAHCSVQGALYGGERAVMLGGDLVLPPGMLKDPRLDYVALGHIHKAQNLNENAHPPVIYPGSIERVDFGEAADDKFFVVAHVEHGHTEVEWRKLEGVRPFIDRYVRPDRPESITAQVIARLPSPEALNGAILRVTLEYPREWEPYVDEAALREYTSECFEFHLSRRPQSEVRIRLPEGELVGSLTPLELLDKYWQAIHTDPDEAAALNALAAEIMHEDQE